MDKELHAVGFRIGSETFALPISLVREIVRVPEITAVPNVPDYIEGVINLRGRIISVLDLRKRFGETNIEKSKKNRVIVVEFADRLVGLLVNSASEVLRIPPADIEAPQDLFRDDELRFVTGVAKLKGRLVIMLDLAKVLGHSDLRRPEEIVEPSNGLEAYVIAQKR
jgi:purine-binding chemotaxis protein CheW